MADNNESNLTADDENKLIAQRREKLQQLRQQREAFPNDFERKPVRRDQFDVLLSLREKRFRQAAQAGGTPNSE
mgnify:CR=1 FL=1